MFCAGVNPEVHKSNRWMIDRGATGHMTWNQDLIEGYELLASQEPVWIANGRQLDTIAFGSVRMEMYQSDSEVQTTLKRVLHVPTMSCNLLSAGAITDNRFRVILEESECHISTKAGKIIGSGRRENHLYILEGKAVREPNHAYVSMSQLSDADIWHRRLGHANDTVLKKLSDDKTAYGVYVGKSVRTTP